MELAKYAMVNAYDEILCEVPAMEQWDRQCLCSARTQVRFLAAQWARGPSMAETVAEPGNSICFRAAKKGKAEQNTKL